MDWTTGLVLLMWQAGKLWQLRERRRFRRRQSAFWDRHEKNMKAIKKGMPEPYPNNCYDWKGEQK